MTINIIYLPAHGIPFADKSFIKTPVQQIAELTAKVASLEAEFAVQKGIVTALLKRF